MKDLIETERSMIDVLNNKTIILIIYSKKDMLKLKKKKRKRKKERRPWSHRGHDDDLGRCWIRCLWSRIFSSFSMKVSSLLSCWETSCPSWLSSVLLSSTTTTSSWEISMIAVDISIYISFFPYLLKFLYGKVSFKLTYITFTR